MVTADRWRGYRHLLGCRRFPSAYQGLQAAVMPAPPNVAANPAGASRLQALRPVRRVAGSLGEQTSAPDSLMAEWISILFVGGVSLGISGLRQLGMLLCLFVGFSILAGIAEDGRVSCIRIFILLSIPSFCGFALGRGWRKVRCHMIATPNKPDPIDPHGRRVGDPER
jgi:hypothetical protein